jgi:hypothetical protein
MSLCVFLRRFTGNDVLCFAENIPEGIQEILKKQFRTHRSQLQPLDEMQEKNRFIR